MLVDLIQSEDEFLALEPEWNLVLAHSPANSIFLTWEWISSWWASYHAGKKLWVLVLRDGSGACQAIAPFYLEGVRHLGRKIRRLRFLGDGSRDSDYLDFIITRGNEASALELIFATLRAKRAQWDALQLNEIPESSPALAALRKALAQSEWLVRTEQVPCAVASLPETWEKYLAGLRPRFRTSLRGCLRTLEEWQGTVERLDTETATEEWLRDLFSLHAGRWQTRSQTGVFADPCKQDFYRRMSTALLRRGWLYFTRLRLGNAVLAVQFGFIYDKTYHQLQEGFDYDTAHIGPGITLRAATLRNLIAEGVTSYDFLAGVNRHKTDWGASLKSSIRMAAAPRHSAGFWYVRGPERVDHLKQMAKAHAPGVLLRLYRRATGSASPETASTNLPADGGTGSPTWQRALATIACKSGALSAARRLSHARARSAKFAILSYHRIGTVGLPLFSVLPRDVFEEHIRFLRSRYRIVSLDEVYEGLVSVGPAEECVAITFDDGYRDLYDQAMPVLRKYGVPATVFLPVGCIESGRVPWYDEIFLALQVAAGDKFDVMLDKPRRFPLGSSQQRIRTAASIVQHLRSLPDEQRRQICGRFRSQVELPPDQLRDRMLTWPQISEMHKEGITFGSHTVTHPALGRLTGQQLHNELADSKRILEARLDRPVLHFAYPFGRPADNGCEAQGMLPRLGYRTGVTTVWGLNLPGDDLFQLRRVALEQEASPALFGFKLTRLFLETRGAAVSSHSLVPGANSPSPADRNLHELDVPNA